MIQRYAIAMACILVASLSAIAHTDTAAGIAQLFFPPTMANLPGVTESREVVAVDADLDSTGKPDYVVAAYTNGTVSFMRVIQRTSAGPVLVAAPTSPAMYETAPRIELLDIDNDGRPEITVAMSTGNRGHRQIWMYKWAYGTVSVYRLDRMVKS